MKNDLINQIEVNDVSDALDILKAAGTEDLFEKGKWKVGDEKVYQGVTYYVSDFNAKGSPKWRKKKGEGKPSDPSPSGNTGGKKRIKIKDYFDEINTALNSNGYYGHLTTSGSIEVYEKGKRISMKNLKASIIEADYINFGPNVGLKDKITSIVKEAVNKKDNEKTASKNNEWEVYSHDINGVTVNVSKNKDGSYTLEANGKKVKSDDPSFFKDKLLPRVKKALAKELGIVAQKSTKTTKTNKSFDIKQIGDFISSIKTTHGDVSFIPKNGTIYLGKRRDYIGDCDEEEKTIELRQNALSNVKRDREAIEEISSALKEKFGFVRKITYKANPRHGLKKAYMKIVLKPSE